MKKFVLNLLLFGIVFFIYDKAFIVFKNLSADKEVDKRLEFLLNGKINKDIIVMGSSRGADNIIAGQIEKEIGKTAYNISYPASNVEFHEFLLRTLLKFNKPPKMILMPLDEPVEFIPTNTQVFRDERLYPLVKYDYINQELVDRGEKNALLSQLFVLHRINKTNLNLRQKKFTPEDTIMPCGSMPISFQKPGRKWIYEINYTYSTANEVQRKVEAFKKIVATCKKRHIKLVLLTVPNYKNLNPAFENRVRKLVNNDAVIYQYNTQNPIYLDKSYFYDENHLNKKGAVIFTHELADYLKSRI